MNSKHRYCAIFLFCLAAFSHAQQDTLSELPLTEEARNLFSQTLFLSSFASQNCEGVSANTPLIQRSIAAIQNGDYRLVEYSVGFNSNNSLFHRYYLRTFDPPALVQLLVLSNDGNCDDFSFSLIEEENIK